MKAKLLWTQKLKYSCTKGFWNIASHLSGKRKGNNLNNLLTEERSPASLTETISATIITDDCSLLIPHNPRDDGKWELSFSEFEVQKCLRKLSQNKAAGPDNIPNKIYSLLAHLIAGPLTAIFERSIKDRIFPDDWKMPSLFQFRRLIPQCSRRCVQSVCCPLLQKSSRNLY